MRTLPVRDSSLIARPITGLPRVLVATPAYLDAHGIPGRPEDLASHNCLDPSGMAQYRWDFRSKGGTRIQTMRVSGTPRANNSFVIRDAALADLGVAILREYLIHDDIAAGRLVPVLTDHVIDERTLHMIYQKDRRLPLRMRVFIDYLSKGRYPSLHRVQQASQKLGGLNIRLASCFGRGFCGGVQFGRQPVTPMFSRAVTPSIRLWGAMCK